MPEMSRPHLGTRGEALLRAGATPEGLTSAEAEERLRHFGPNRLQEKKTSKVALFLRQFRSVLIYILLAAAVLTLILGDARDFLIVVLLILANAVIGFFQEKKAQDSVEALRKLTESHVLVMRDGRAFQMASSLLVPGDVIIVAEGDLVSADARLLEAHGLRVDESVITGESLPAEKDASSSVDAAALPFDWKNSLISGTIVVGGTGQAVVTATGQGTYMSSVAERAEDSPPPSPLTKALSIFLNRYIIIVVIIVLLIGLIGLIQARSPASILYLMVAQLVSSVPEGLPLVITLVMVVGAVQLSKHRTLVRHLPAVETLGSATVIACDKTGTITQGRLQVVMEDAIDAPHLRLCAALCNDSREGLGDPIDVALANWLGQDYGGLREACPREWVLPFDSRTRLMASCNLVNGTRLLFVKGALEALRPTACGGLECREAETQRLAGEGLRVLAFAVGTGEKDDISTWKLELVGLLGLLDPPKPGVRETVEKAKGAGIRFIMVTGDHPTTARAVAEQVSIYTRGDGVLTGSEMETMDDDRLRAELKLATVLARTVPEQKYRVVRVLQEAGEVVTVTGDGVNDVAALNAGDLGVSMGSGTEAAKSASKMIIVDDNLGTLVEAVRIGREIAGNLRKVIYYLLSTSINQMVLILAALVFFLPVPLTAIQILWINLVTDGVQDKTFPFTKAEGDVMTRPPLPPQRQFFDRKQMWRVMYFGVLAGAVLLVMFALLLDRAGLAMATTMVFTALVVGQWVNGIQAQKENDMYLKDVRNSVRLNPYIFLGVGLGLLLQLVAMYALADWFDVVPLGAFEWAAVAVFALMIFFSLEARKAAEALVWARRQDQRAE
jgi:Ca2+-transporting ATPase